LYPYCDPPISPSFHVGYLGNDSFWQGLPLILEAAKILQSEKNIRFVLGGFDPKNYQNYGLVNTDFAGVVPRGEDIRDGSIGNDAPEHRREDDDSEERS